MKKAVKILIIVMAFIAILSLSSAKVSVAKSSSSYELTSEKSDLFRIVRVQENGKWFIYIYLESGMFVSKFEEL